MTPEAEMAALLITAIVALTAIPVIGLAGFAVWLVVTRTWCPPNRKGQ